MSTPARHIPQGFFPSTTDRMPLMPRDAMSPAQREAADAIIAGPRKAVFGPFIPLLRSPQLMGRIGDVGAYLRFESTLDARIRELAICVAARHTANQFEWLMHAPLAVAAGVAQATWTRSPKAGSRAAWPTTKPPRWTWRLKCCGSTAAATPPMPRR
jgi:4-carboxymuconolactone decarboxylase